VKVGRHIPAPAEEIDGMLARFGAVYGGNDIGTLGRIVAGGAAHHRLLWIHPFLDGNGRVARLFSHAFLRELGIGCELWSISRGLARNIDKYKELLMAADEPRHGDLDGRGALSLKALEQFCWFFLTTCLDQVEFMGGLLDRQAMLGRMEIWTEEQQRLGNLAPGSWPLLREAVLAGEFARGKAPALTGYQDRQARTVLASLIKMGVLVSDTPLGPVRLAFRDSVVERWLPTLYPAHA
jgi:Fic family protein